MIAQTEVSDLEDSLDNGTDIDLDSDSSRGSNDSIPTLEEYSAKIQSGDEFACHDLLESYDEYVDRITRFQSKLIESKFRVKVHYDDLKTSIQDAMITTAQGFDPSRAGSFKTFLPYILRKKRKEFLREFYDIRKVKGPRFLTIYNNSDEESLSKVNSLKSKENTPQDNLENREENHELDFKIARLYELFSNKQLEYIYYRHVEGLKYSEIADKYDASRQWITESISNLERILEAKAQLISLNFRPSDVAAAIHKWHFTYPHDFDMDNANNQTIKFQIQCLEYLAGIDDEPPIKEINYLSLPVIKQTAIEINRQRQIYGNTSLRLNELVKNLYPVSVYKSISKPGLELSDEDIQSRVKTMLDKLPKKDKKYFVMNYGENLGINEIAELSGPSPPFVKKQLRIMNSIIGRDMCETYILSDPKRISDAVTYVSKA